MTILNGVVQSNKPILMNQGNPIHLAVNIEKFKYKYDKFKSSIKDFLKCVNYMEIGLTINDKFLNSGAVFIEETIDKNITIHGISNKGFPSASMGKVDLLDLAPSSKSLATVQSKMQADFREKFQLAVATQDISKMDKKAYYTDVGAAANEALQETVSQFQAEIAGIISKPYSEKEITKEYLQKNVAEREWLEETQHRLVDQETDEAISFHDLETLDALTPARREDLNCVELNQNMESGAIIFRLPTKAKLVKDESLLKEGETERYLAISVNPMSLEKRPKSAKQKQTQSSPFLNIATKHPKALLAGSLGLLTGMAYLLSSSKRNNKRLIAGTALVATAGVVGLGFFSASSPSHEKKDTPQRFNLHYQSYDGEKQFTVSARSNNALLFDCIKRNFGTSPEVRLSSEKPKL